MASGLCLALPATTIPKGRGKEEMTDVYIGTSTEPDEEGICITKELANLCLTLSGTIDGLLVPVLTSPEITPSLIGPECTVVRSLGSAIVPPAFRGVLESHLFMTDDFPAKQFNVQLVDDVVHCLETKCGGPGCFYCSDKFGQPLKYYLFNVIKVTK